MEEAEAEILATEADLIIEEDFNINKLRLLHRFNVSKSNNTVCIRCGKERILSKTWKEHKDNSLITYSLFVCPDALCQRIVDNKLQKEKDRIDAIQAKSLKRRKENIRNRKTKKQP